MNNPEQHAPDGEAMGQGREEYSRLNSEVASDKERYAERDRYRVLADAARRDGETELADRLDQYALAINSQLIEEFTKMEVESAMEMLSEMTDPNYADGPHGELIALAFPGGEFSNAALSGIREALIAPENRKRAKIERTTDPNAPQNQVVRYIVPMQEGVQYEEAYYEEDEITEVKLYRGRDG
jgi:hypothetical protein